MSGRNPEFDAWRADIRGVRTTVRALAAPSDDPLGLLSPGEELLGLLVDSPEALPLVTFSPFAGLPGGAAPAPARRTEGPVQKAGRAPGVPPMPSRVEPPSTAGRSAAAVPSRSPAQPPVAAVEAIRAQPVQTTPPVFSFRRPGGQADPVPSTPEARGTVQAGDPGAPPAKRALSLSDLLSLKSDKAWPEEQGIAESPGDPANPALPPASRSSRPGGGPPSVPPAYRAPEPLSEPGTERVAPPALATPPAPGRTLSLSDLPALESEKERPRERNVAESPRKVPPGIAATGGSSRPGGGLSPVLPVRGAPESLVEAGSGGADPLEIPLAPETGHSLELLNDLADRALRRQDGAAPESEPGTAGAPLAGNLAPVPDRRGLSAPESAAASNWPPALAVEGEGKARLLAMETGTPGPESTPALPASGGPPLLDAETLADLINEALVEQARRHGVDLS